MDSVPFGIIKVSDCLIHSDIISISLFQGGILFLSNEVFPGKKNKLWNLKNLIASYFSLFFLIIFWLSISYVYKVFDMSALLGDVITVLSFYVFINLINGATTFYIFTRIK